MGTVLGCKRSESAKEPKSRELESSPRDIVRFQQPERRDAPSSGYEGFREDSRSWQWNEGMLKIPQRGAGVGFSNYKPLKVEDEEDDDHKIVRTVSQCSQSQALWVEEWLESVESGELDVYTCLSLSNAFTWTPDTRKLLAKVFAVTVLQIFIPCIMLYLETVEGLTIEPAEPGKGFRAIGSALYLYSVYSMYNNALDECRSRLLNFAFRYKLPAGYWAPLLLGEVSNVLVSIVLVITLYIIYTHLIQPADLILNAVAVNFLGSVDAEFVNADMKKDALNNFKDLTNAILENPELNPSAMSDPDEEGNVDEGGDEHQDTVVDKIVRVLLYGIAFSGIILSVVFFVAPTAAGEAKEEKNCRMNRR